MIRRKRHTLCAFLLYAAASNIFSIKMPYPVVGSFTRTWVTAPTSLPSWMMGLPDTQMSSRGQKNFVFFCGFYAFLQVKGRFLHTSTVILNLTDALWPGVMTIEVLLVFAQILWHRPASAVRCLPRTGDWEHRRNRAWYRSCRKQPWGLSPHPAPACHR